jgi:hypothetical protein
MEKLLKQVKELEIHIPDYAKRQPAVSAANVGWHIEHSLMVFATIITALENSDPALYKGTFSMKKFLVYALNKIPRGRGQAPKVVQPVGEMIPENVLPQVGKAVAKIKALGSLQRHHHFPHPYFGKLNLKETIKFLKIHTKHHLKIIEDILNVKSV